MVDSINIPQELFEIEVVNKTDVLKTFLTDLLIRVENLESTVVDLQTQIDELS